MNSGQQKTSLILQTQGAGFLSSASEGVAGTGHARCQGPGSKINFDLGGLAACS